MGLLGALFKPFKKLVKKIGKKVKKVFKKIGKAIGKLGIVGQIGMMFLMPYAAGALGSFFGTAGTLSKWGATLLSKPGIGRAALGHTLNAINTVGTTIGKVYTGVTDTISNAFDTVMNKGTQFLERTGFKTPGASTPTDALTDLSSAVESGQAIDPSLRPPVDTNLMRIKPESNLTEELYKNYQKQATESSFSSSLESVAGGGGKAGREAAKSLLEIDPVKVAAKPSINITKPTLPPVKRNILEEGFDFVTENIQQGLADAKQQAGEKLQAMVTDPVGQITDEVTGRVKETATTKLMETIGLEEPTQEEQAGSFNSPAVVSQIQTDSGINFTNSYAIDAFAKQGNNHLAYGLANTGHVASIFDPQNNPTTNQFMTSYYIAPNVSRQLGVA